MRMTVGVFMLALCACQAADPGPGEIRSSERELLAAHKDIWDLLELSVDARMELDGLVLTLKRGIDYNEMRRPELADQLPGTLPPLSRNREEFFAIHRNRFNLLKISKPTQAELFVAMNWVWDGLHDPKATTEQKERAKKVRELMLPQLLPCQKEDLKK